VKQNHQSECYSEAEGVPSLGDGSESGDEQYGAQGCQAINSVAHNLSVDSASSELGDAFSIQEDDIDSVFCDALEDHASEHDFIPIANEHRSPFPEKSSA
jgi:hypothetical protein